MEDSDWRISMILAPKFLITLITTTITSAVIRICYIIHHRNKPVHNLAQQSLSTLIVLGSGGHTAEMLNLLSVLQKDRFMPRTYVAALTDNMSLQKARVFEDSLVDQILCNGPGTCIPLCVIAFLFKILGIRWSLRKLSLSGLLLYKLQIADQVFVHWPQLQKKYPRTHYIGCLM